MWRSMVVVLGLGIVALPTLPATAGSIERRAALLVPRTDHEALRSTIYAIFPRAAQRWGAVHILHRDCSMSRAVLAHLTSRRASAEVDELVIVVDPEGATRRQDIDLVHAGFRVRVIPQHRAAEIAPIATPSMVIARPDGTLAYVGGHHREASGFIDTALIRDLVSTGSTFESAPVIGCALQR